MMERTPVREGGGQGMSRTCRLCRGLVSSEDCYARLDEGECPVCRACWEQLLLDPRRILRQLERLPLDRTPPPFPALKA